MRQGQALDYCPGHLIQLMKVKVFKCHISILVEFCWAHFCLSSFALEWAHLRKQNPKQSDKMPEAASREASVSSRWWYMLHISSYLLQGWASALSMTPVFSTARQSDVIGCLFFFLLLISIKLISEHGLVTSLIFLLPLSTPSLNCVQKHYQATSEKPEKQFMWITNVQLLLVKEIYEIQTKK